MPPPVPQILAPSPKTVSHALRNICAKFGAFTQKCTIFAIFGANRPDYKLFISWRNSELPLIRGRYEVLCVNIGLSAS